MHCTVQPLYHASSSASSQVLHYEDRFKVNLLCWGVAAVCTEHCDSWKMPCWSHGPEVRMGRLGWRLYWIPRATGQVGRYGGVSSVKLQTNSECHHMWFEPANGGNFTLHIFFLFFCCCFCSFAVVLVYVIPWELRPRHWQPTLLIIIGCRYCMVAVSRAAPWQLFFTCEEQLLDVL